MVVGRGRGGGRIGGEGEGRGVGDRVGAGLLVQRRDHGTEGGESGRRETALDGKVDAVEAVLGLELGVPGPG